MIDRLCDVEGFKQYKLVPEIDSRNASITIKNAFLDKI